MSSEDLNIDVQRDRLIVSGEKRVDQESVAGSYRTLQCAYGSFRREVALPQPVDARRAKASYRDGVLRVDMPRAEPGGGRRIAVRSA